MARYNSRLRRKLRIADENMQDIQNTSQDASQNNSQGDSQIVEEIHTLLDRIQQSADDLQDIYYSLFDNLTALYTSYPSIYQQLEKIVKLPTNDRAMEIVSFNNDLKQAISHFKDPVYLNSYISNSSETI